MMQIFNVTPLLTNSCYVGIHSDSHCTTSQTYQSSITIHTHFQLQSVTIHCVHVRHGGFLSLLALRKAF